MERPKSGRGIAGVAVITAWMLLGELNETAFAPSAGGEGAGGSRPRPTGCEWPVGEDLAPSAGGEGTGRRGRSTGESHSISEIVERWQEIFVARTVTPLLFGWRLSCLKRLSIRQNELKLSM